MKECNNLLSDKKIILTTLFLIVFCKYGSAQLEAVNVVGRILLSVILIFLVLIPILISVFNKGNDPILLIWKFFLGAIGVFVSLTSLIRLNSIDGHGSEGSFFWIVILLVGLYSTISVFVKKK